MERQAVNILLNDCVNLLNDMVLKANNGIRPGASQGLEGLQVGDVVEAAGFEALQGRQVVVEKLKRGGFDFGTSDDQGSEGIASTQEGKITGAFKGENLQVLETWKIPNAAIINRMEQSANAEMSQTAHGAKEVQILDPSEFMKAKPFDDAELTQEGEVREIGKTAEIEVSDVLRWAWGRRQAPAIPVIHGQRETVARAFPGFPRPIEVPRGHRV